MFLESATLTHVVSENSHHFLHPELTCSLSEPFYSVLLQVNITVDMSSSTLWAIFMADNCNRRCKAVIRGPWNQLAEKRQKRVPVITSTYYNLSKLGLLSALALTVISVLIHSSPVEAESLYPGALDEKVDTCEACRIVVDSFNKGMEDTSRGKHEGGDTLWEEKNLKSYADSELRLVEIQENLCQDVKAGKDQCLSLIEEADTDIEVWWFKERPKGVDFFEYLCINRQKRCCQKDTFGPDCQPCTANCNDHGTCDGAGTRQGTGECSCYLGYQGEECTDCALDHYRVGFTDQFKCLRCHSACGSCTGPSHKNCTTCRDGYYRNDMEGCIDIDECQLDYDNVGDNRICKAKTYCVNTDGSYRCDDCHVSCSECTDYGSHSCLTCAKGYRFNSRNICVSNERFHDEDDDDEDAEDPLEYQLSKLSMETRIISYFAVWMLSMVFLRNNTSSMVLWTVFSAAMIAFTESRIIINRGYSTISS